MALHRMPAGGTVPHPAGRLAPVASGWLMAGAVLAVTALVVSLLVPPPLVLLATGGTAVGIGFAVAAGLLLSGHRMGQDGTTGWDTASALVFLGFAAALLADTGEVLGTFAALQER